MSNNSKQIVELGYDQVVSDYANLEGKREWPRMRWLKKVLSQLEPGSSVLDLGCGSGDPAAIEIAKAHQVSGVDISQAHIDLARQNVPSGNFQQGDVGSVDFSSASFEAVVSFYTLEHIPRREHQAILERIYQWLRPGGLLLFSIEAADLDDVTGEWLGVPMFFSIFPPETMRAMVKAANFEILETAIEVQFEGETEIPYLWILARRRDSY